MDLYGSWDPALASSSGANTPVRETPDQASIEAGTSSNDGASGQGQGNASASSSAAANKARPPTIEQEIEQMGTLVSGMGKNLGSYWSSFRRQVRLLLYRCITLGLCPNACFSRRSCRFIGGRHAFDHPFTADHVHANPSQRHRAKLS